MKVLSIVILSILLHTVGISRGVTNYTSAGFSFPEHMALLIDSSDHVIIDLNQLTYDGEYIEVPVFIESDEVINTLDFSFLVNIANLEFDSVIDYTGDLQFAAFLNPNDLKLRFTSNSFSSYPVLPEKVVSLRFRMLSGIVHKSDFQMIVTYLNGEKCTNLLQSVSEDILLASEEGEISSIQIFPNPAAHVLFIVTDEESKVDLIDSRGMIMLYHHLIHPKTWNEIPVDQFPRGLYTIRITNGKRILHTLQVVLQ